MRERYTGTVRRVVPNKGFGFIRHEASNDEYFFHRSACDTKAGCAFEDLREGTAVTFEMGNSSKGARAEQVRLL